MLHPLLVLLLINIFNKFFFRCNDKRDSHSYFEKRQSLGSNDGRQIKIGELNMINGGCKQ